MNVALNPGAEASGMLYVHFTSREHALEIVRTLRLLPCKYLSSHRSNVPAWSPPPGHACDPEDWSCAVCSGAGCVYAQVEGGAYVPGVQRGTGGGFGRVPGLRRWAVVFLPERDADEVSEFGEEVEWFTLGADVPLVLREAVAVTAEEARLLLGREL